MLGCKVRKGFRVALLAGTCLAATPAAAQDAEFEARLNRLETLVMGLIERLDAQEGQMEANQAENAAAAEAALAETRAMQARQEKLAAQIEEPKKQEDKGFRVGNTTVSRPRRLQDGSRVAVAAS